MTGLPQNLNNVEKDVKRAKQHRPPIQPSLPKSVLTLLLLMVLWIVFVGGTRIDEMIVGAGAIMLCGAFLYLVWRTETLKIDLKMVDLAQGWRVPWYILTSSYEIIAIFVKDLSGAKKSQSLFRVSGFKTSPTNPQLIARRVLAIFYTTMAPNFIVIGVDPRQNRMLFHQLKRSSIPKMTQALGARSGGSQS